MFTDIFSKRQRRLREGVPDVYGYDHVPQPLRVQISQILKDAIGREMSTYTFQVEDAYAEIHDALAREYGVFRLTQDRSASARVHNFLLHEPETAKVLDVVELGFRAAEVLARKSSYKAQVAMSASPSDAISELNARFLEHAVGYQYASGGLIRIDSAIIHSEVVKPALRILADASYAGTDEEFLSAHEHYRHARYEEAMTDCLKALESTLKSICTKRGWAYAETDTAKKLLDVVFANELIPSYLQSEFTSLRSTLESGVPTVRNKQAGHGQGVQVRQVPQHLASYVLHLTATSILFLAQAEQALPA